MTQIAIDFYPRPERNAKRDTDAAAPKKLEPVASVPSSVRFQLSHMLSDLALRAARHSKAVRAGQSPVTYEWKSDLAVEVAVTIDGHEIRHAYPQSALRGDETLTRWLATSEDPLEAVKKHRSLMFIGRPLADSEQPASAPRRTFRLRAVGTESAELSIRVEDYATLDAIDLDDLCRLGGKHFRLSDLPVVIPRQLLVDLAREEAERPEPFVERGWYLLGRVGRNGTDLCLIAEDIVAAEHTEGTDTSLDWSAETKIALVDEIDRRSEAGLDQRVVGWIHSHGPILESEGDEVLEALAEAKAKAGPIDYRFFSRIDVTMHRKDFGPAAIALVLDAEAARDNPNDPARCFACFGTVSGVVVRRGVYISEARTNTDNDTDKED